MEQYNKELKTDLKNLLKEILNNCIDKQDTSLLFQILRDTILGLPNEFIQENINLGILDDIQEKHDFLPEEINVDKEPLIAKFTELKAAIECACRDFFEATLPRFVSEIHKEFISLESEEKRQTIYAKVLVILVSKVCVIKSDIPSALKEATSLIDGLLVQYENDGINYKKNVDFISAELRKTKTITVLRNHLLELQTMATVASKILSSSKQLDPAIATKINENIWELL